MCPELLRYVASRHLLPAPSRGATAAAAAVAVAAVSPITDMLTQRLQTDSKKGKKAKSNLDARFSDIDGNAMSDRGKKGKSSKDDSHLQELAGGGFGGDQGYEPYVFYEFEII